MIALCLIARDEERCLGRCLDSVAPHVDEMLVVDTGSADATTAVARAHGARVEHFPWQDDFSAARNFSLSRTTADWILVLDADEWIEEGGACLRECAAAGMPFVGQVMVRNAFDDAGQVRHAPTWVSRVLPRGVHYRGRIHEQVEHAHPVRRLPLVVGHDGYREAQQAAKQGRNERLLRVQLREDPGNAYGWYQLGKDLEVHRRFPEAADAYARARRLAGWPPAAPAAATAMQARLPWLHDLAARSLYCLKQARRFAEGLARVGDEQDFWRDSPDFQFAAGDLLLDYALAEPARAAELLPAMEARWRRCLEIGEAPHLEGAVEGRGSFLAEHNLAVYYELSGQREQAARYRRLGVPAVPRS